MIGKSSGKFLIISTFSFFLLLSGCVHTLEVTNLPNYQGLGFASLQKPFKIGVITSAVQPEEKELINSIATSLSSSSARVTLPYLANGGSDVDAVVNIDIITRYDGSGWNFLVDFPGFLIFTPAWNGYIYTVHYDLTCTIINPKTKQTVDTFKLPFKLDIKQADFNRTWKTGLDWVLTDGAVDLIGGLFDIGYDSSVTPNLIPKIEETFGRYTAQEIVKHLNSGNLTTS